MAVANAKAYNDTADVMAVKTMILAEFKLNTLLKQTILSIILQCWK